MARAPAACFGAAQLADRSATTLKTMPCLHPLARFVALFWMLAASVGHAQTTASVVMLSDLHFDPFHDPAKLSQLRADPIERWPAILAGAPSPTQAADLQALQTACGARALDTAWSLLQTSLRAAHNAEPRPTFVTLSGDLLAHEFPCRFKQLSAGATEQELASFSAKTVAFVLLQTRLSFPRVPVFGALGNNDSGCADYRETPGSLFLKESSATLAMGAAGSSVSFTPEGDYSVALPAPMRHTRLVVVENIFAARQFNTCAAAADRTPEKAQVDWLRAQLADARSHGEQVWVMAHIPPGVDVYSSFRRYVLQPAKMCSAEPRPFLADTTLADALLDFADVVRLAVFGHTHMDEIRVLQRESTASDGNAQNGQAAVAGSATVVPAKIVPSITPWAGNHPAFVAATVDTRTAVLKDWRTVVSPGVDGSTPPWADAYRFTAAYHLPDFSAASAAKLAQSFVQDKTGQTPTSAAFREHFYPGDVGLYALGLGQIWPAYACSVREHRPSAVHDCICAAVPNTDKGDAAP